MNVLKLFLFFQKHLTVKKALKKVNIIHIKLHTGKTPVLFRSVCNLAGMPVRTHTFAHTVDYCLTKNIPYFSYKVNDL